MVATENTTSSKTVRRMLGLSLHAWEDIMALSLATAAAAAVVVGVSTYIVIQLTRHANEEAAKQIAELALQGDQLRKDTAEANARSAEAQLALAKFKADRNFDPRSIAPRVAPFAGMEWDAVVVSGDLEADNLLNTVALALGRVRWLMIDWNGPVPSRQPAGAVRRVGPLPSSFGGVFTRGTLITVHPEWTKDPNSPQMKAAEALAAALKEDAGIDCAGVIGMDLGVNSSAIHVVISRK
jgi:hypothetical protein